MTPAQYNEYQRQANVIDEAKKWKKEEMGKQQTEISDEEIDKAADYMDETSKYFFKYGAQWYKEQLKKKQ